MALKQAASSRAIQGSYPVLSVYTSRPMSDCYSNWASRVSSAWKRWPFPTTAVVFLGCPLGTRFALLPASLSPQPESKLTQPISISVKPVIR